MTCSTQRPEVTALISTYNARRFFAGCMEHVLGQTLYAQGRLEVIVIDSGSQQGEAELAREYAARCSGITVIETPRETLYAAWNRGVERSRGRYIVNANTDDRHHPQAFERMAQKLGETGAALCYADTYLTREPGADFSGALPETVLALPQYSLRQALLDCPFGPVTMWRADAHEVAGPFPEDLGIAGDYVFFLKAAWRRGAVHLPQALAVCYESPQTLSGNTPAAVGEGYAFLPALRRRIPLDDIYPFLAQSPQSRHVALADWADLLLFAGGGFSDPDHAVELYAAARDAGASDFVTTLNTAVAHAKAGRMDAALQGFASLTPQSRDEQRLVVHNLQCIRQGAPVWRMATVRMEHPLLETLPPIVPLSTRRVTRDAYAARSQVPAAASHGGHHD